MGIADAEPGLSQEEREICETVHLFSRDILRPIGQELDKYPDPNQVIAPESPLWRVFDKYRELGIDPFSLATTDIPLERQALLRSIISEEMGWGDPGLAISVGVSIFPRVLSLLSGSPTLIEQFNSPEIIGCWPITEPDHGSDVILFGGKFSEFPGTPNCIAKKEGDNFVINGQKAAWVSNGTIANAAALFCALDLGEGPIGLGGFVLSLDEPGITRGKPLDKIGQRPLNQGEIFFDHVVIPSENLVIKPGGDAMGNDGGLALANSSMGSTFVGVAQASYELALNYSKERIQGGQPIFRHQSVKARIFEMYKKVEYAKALSRRAVYLNTVGPPNLPIAVASKVTATQCAFDVASAAIQIFGGNGLSREYPVEKLLRDARASMIEDGCNEVLSLVASERL
ncbi:MAG: acyl-CoA dehydrogenase [Acidimicrobiales bacterium]|nr:acyl-CoA dehydrogenase [Acidimicrobiales bacterium]